MAAQSPSELLKWLLDNQFLPEQQAEELQAILTSFADRHALVKDLVRRSWLTPFQANQIVTDKGDTLVFGPFRVLERLGEGAMGQVFKAWHTRLGKFVAVKVLHPNLIDNAKALQRFYQEMATAAQLNHPNIVLVLDANEVDNRPYMLMEYCEGFNLSQMVKKQGALAIHVACDYVRQAAVGLQHAAELGVIHRDVKPSNLLLTKAATNRPAQIKILDFGLGRATGNTGPDRLTMVGNLLGTIDYIAPEQIENAQNADVRADIYSLGCTFYYLLAGKPPYSGTTMLEKVSGRLLGQLPNVREARPEISPALDALLKRMMAKKPEDRFQTASDLAAAIEPFCSPNGPTVPVAQPVRLQVRPEVVPPPQPTRLAGSLSEATPVGVSKTLLLLIGAGLFGLLLLIMLIAAFANRGGKRAAAHGTEVREVLTATLDGCDDPVGRTS